MPTRQELKDLARLRLKEAEALFAAGCYNGAVYLCGYAVEVALKARICRLLGVDRYPDTGPVKGVYAVHDLDQLLLLSGLRGKVGPKEAPLFKNWGETISWNPSLRYRPPDAISRSEARESLDAICHPEYGVLRWIRKYW